MGEFKKIIKEGVGIISKMGAYERGRRHAAEGQSRAMYKRVNIEEYDKGYDDELERQKIQAIKNRE